MINLPYSLVIEATEDPSFLGFYSPDLEGFTGLAIGSRIAFTKPDGVLRNMSHCFANAVYLFPPSLKIPR